MPPTLGTDNDVTLAVLASKMDNLRDVVLPLQARIESLNDALEARVRCTEEKIARLEERMTIWQAAQALYATIASAIAAFLGTR